MLQEITRLKIDYLYHLDYVDFNSLSNTNKEFFKLLNNDTTLRNILYKQCDNDIYLPPDFPILKALNELHNEITIFMYKLYPINMRWPRWINIEMFRNDLKRNIYIYLYDKISGFLYNKGKIVLDINIYEMKIIILDRAELIFPFAAYNDDEYLVTGNIEDNKFYQSFNKELHLSDTILNYFRHSLKYLNDKYNINIDDDNIHSLLFTRNYTYGYAL